MRAQQRSPDCARAIRDTIWHAPRNSRHEQELIPAPGSVAMNDIRSKELYSSPNGDRWHLCKDGTGRLFIAHHANLPSGGHISRIELADFLARGYGPEQQSLLKLIGTLLDPAPLSSLAVKVSRVFR
jgi:hypothetical protein